MTIKLATTRKCIFCAIKKRLYNIFLIGFFAILFLDRLLWPFKYRSTSTVDTFIFVHKKWKKQIRTLLTLKDLFIYYNQLNRLFYFKFHFVLKYYIFARILCCIECGNVTSYLTHGYKVLEREVDTHYPLWAIIFALQSRGLHNIICVQSI